MYRNLSVTAFFSLIFLLIALTSQPTSLEADVGHDPIFMDEVNGEDPPPIWQITSHLPTNSNLELPPAGSTIRVSVNNNAIESNALSYGPSIASTGLVFFSTGATNFSSGSGSYVRDFIDGATEFISRNLITSCISDNGRFIVGTLTVDGLVPSDTNGSPDVFVYDRFTGGLELVSLNSEGQQGNGSSGTTGKSSISANGRYVVFESRASNLTLNDTNDAIDVFVYDRVEKKIEIASVSSDGILGDKEARLGFRCTGISADGTRVVFQSNSSNLVANDSNNFTDIFVHDLISKKTVLVSKSSSGAQDQTNSSTGAISGDGNVVAFVSRANLTEDHYAGQELFVHDMRQDFENGETSLVCVPLDKEPTYRDTLCLQASLSQDGNLVAFNTRFGGLVPEDTNNVDDVFVYNRATEKIIRVSESTQGEQSNDRSYFSQISASGQFVVFHSYATNLISNDTNDEGDVFVHVLPPAPPTPTFEVSGKVTDSDGNPLASVTVTLDNSTTALSNASGQYEFNNLLAGTYKVSVSLIGYNFSTSSQTVMVPPDQEDIDFVGRIIDPCKALQGYVHDATTNAPLQGVEVTIDDPTTGSVTALSNENGYYYFPSDDNSPSFLSASLAGYNTYTTVVSIQDSCPIYSFVMWHIDPQYDELAKEYAPEWHQGVDKRDPAADYITNFDFDNNWNGIDNWQNQPDFDLRAYIYYSVVETNTHYFILYADFHPRDWGGNDTEPCTGNSIPFSSLNCHENDMEGALVAVKKLENGQTRVEFLETVFHKGFESYQGGQIEFADGTHAILAVEPLGHGVEAGKNDNEIEGDWIITYKEGGKAGIPVGNKNQTVDYQLVLIDNDLWARRHDYKWIMASEKTYEAWGDFAEDEEGLNDLPEHYYWINAHPPWGWFEPLNLILPGKFFWDPAFVIDKEFELIEDLDRNYTYNPYLYSKGVVLINEGHTQVNISSNNSQETAIMSNDGTTIILVPVDALDSSIIVTHEPSSNEEYYLEGLIAAASNESNANTGTDLGIDSGVREIVLHPFEISAEDLATKTPIPELRKDYTVKVNYTDRDVAGYFEETLQLYRWNGSSWIAEPTSTQDTEKNSVSLSSSKFGIFAVLGVPKHEVFMPVAMKAAQP